MKSALMLFKPPGMLKRFQSRGRLGSRENCTASHRSTMVSGRPWSPGSSLRDLIWTGWSGGHAVPGALGLRRPRWRWMSGLTVNTSAELCSPIALKSHRRAFWSACPQNCAALPLRLPTLSGFSLPAHLGSTSWIFSTDLPRQPAWPEVREWLGSVSGAPEPYAKFITEKQTSRCVFSGEYKLRIPN